MTDYTCAITPEHRQHVLWSRGSDIKWNSSFIVRLDDLGLKLRGNGRLMALNFTTDTKRLICLAALLGIYLLSGAVVFQVLENENDKFEIQQLNSVKKLFLEKHNMTPDDFDFLVEKVENAVKHRCGGDPDQWCTSRWTYYASVYFTWSVVTTVGKEV